MVFVGKKDMVSDSDEIPLLNLQQYLSRLSLLIIDDLGDVPLSPTGAELLFDEWTEVFGSERLTGALLDRLTHHVHILEMNGDSYRLRSSRENASAQAPDELDNP